jgi:hypothetical protein
MQKYIRIFEDDAFKNTWTQDIFSKGNSKSAVAIFLNKGTNTLMASAVYTEKIIDAFIEDTLKSSQGKLTHITTLDETSFKQKYNVIKEIPQIGLSIILER